MVCEFSSILSAPIEEVFGWHARPGALARLAPPWQPVQVRAEADSLAFGRAVLALPGGLPWVAAHDPTGYRPPEQFVDELSSWPLRAAVRWRHTHRFTAVGETITRMTDHVDTNVPVGLLRPMFGYRHRQLAGDLAAHRDATSFGATPLTVAVTGASGLVGSALTAFLTTGGHRVIRLVRREPRTPDERRWRPDDPSGALLDGVDAVVHLAGTPIAGRFTADHKNRLRSSRIEPTRLLAEVAAHSTPGVLVTASAVGYYGPDRGDEILTEDSDRGDGALADIVTDWEEAAAPARDAGMRVAHIRTGIVQSPRGGTLRLLRPLFAAGLGGRIGTGGQWLSWIGIDDLVDVYHRALVDPGFTGQVNAVAPHPVRNADYAAALGRVLNRPTLLPVPDAAPRLVLGDEGARELATANQRVRPQRLLAAGHRFRYPRLEPALRHLFGRT